MFVSSELKTHLESSSTVQLQSLVLAEWNMNMPDNIQKLGNYRYRPNGTDTKFKTISNIFDPADAAGFYTGATDADIAIDGGYTDSDVPQFFVSKKEYLRFSISFRFLKNFVILDITILKFLFLKIPFSKNFK